MRPLVSSHLTFDLLTLTFYFCLSSSLDAPPPPLVLPMIFSSSSSMAFLTSDDELSLRADGGGVVAGDAGVVAVMLERHLGDLQRAHELLGLYGDARVAAGHDVLAVLAPGEQDGHVARRHHTRHVHQLPDGSGREVKRLDERGNCRKNGRRDGKVERKREMT